MKNVHVFVPVFLYAVTMLIFRLKELFQVKNGVTTSLLLLFFENAKNLGRSDDGKRRKKEDGLSSLQNSTSLFASRGKKITFLGETEELSERLLLTG